MSKKTLTELASQRVLDARARRAEAAERAVEAWLAWCDSGNVDGTWDAYMQALAAYKDACEVVRKLEDGAKPDDRD